MSSETDLNGNTTKVTSGSWERIEGKMQFVENSFVVPAMNEDLENTPSDFKVVSNNVLKDGEPSSTSYAYPYFSDSTDIYIHEIGAKLEDLENRLDLLQQENKSLKSKVRGNEKHLDEQLSYIYSLEKVLSRLDQYGRRENIEIQGIPADVPDMKLEGEVLKILHCMGLTRLSHFGIVACHRIGRKDSNGCRNTIIRFLNRKDAIATLVNKNKVYLCKNLGYDNLRVSENLCPAYRSIFDELVELKEEGSIQKVWSFNGQIKYILTDGEQEKTRKVHHESDLDILYK